MPHESELPEPWRKFLVELDAMLSEEVTLHCMGGFVVTAFYGVARRTRDIDVLSIVPRDASVRVNALASITSVLAKRHGVYIQQVGIADLPEDYALAAKLNLEFSVLQSRFDAEMKLWLPNLSRHELTLKLWSEYFSR